MHVSFFNDDQGNEISNSDIDQAEQQDHGWAKVWRQVPEIATSVDTNGEPDSDKYLDPGFWSQAPSTYHLQCK